MFLKSQKAFLLALEPLRQISADLSADLSADNNNNNNNNNNHQVSLEEKQQDKYLHH